MPLEEKDLHIDAVLSTMSVMYRNGNYVADQLLPRISVKKKSDKIKEYDKTVFKQINSLRRDKTPSSGIYWGFAEDIPYICEKYALHDLVSEDDRDNADLPINADIDTTEIINELLMLDREIRVKTLLTTTANYSGVTHYPTLGASAKWDNYEGADSKPLETIDDAKAVIFTDTRKAPNVVMIPYKVSLKLAHHPNILEIIKYTKSDLLTAGGLPPTLQGLRVIEAQAGYDTSQHPQTPSIQDVWSDYVWIGYVVPNPGLKTISFGVSPTWKGKIARKWHDNDKNADVIEIEEQGIDEKIIAKDCGYLIQDVLT